MGTNIEIPSVYPTIDEIVFRVALEYENLFKGQFLKLDLTNLSSAKRKDITTKTGINYAKKENDEFVLYLKLMDYTIKADGEHYLFREVPIGGKFHLKGSLIAFTGPPTILCKEHYHHPCVYENNQMDYGGRDRWIVPNIDIQWFCWYDTTKRSTIYKIAKWLDEGRIALQEGCFGGINQVHLLNRDNFSSEYRTAEEALRCGVKIIANRWGVCHQIH